jgi:hypothetical protein
LGEFCELRFGSRNAGPMVMIMARGAFDASMDSPSGITAVAGYVGTPDQWQAVEDKWLPLLSLRGFARLRMSELFHIHKFDDALKIAQGFAEIVGQSDLRFVCAHMLETDWAILDKEDEFLTIYPERQHACLDLLLTVLAQELELEYRDIPAAIIFDNDYGNIEMAGRVYERWKARQGHPGFDYIGFTRDSVPWGAIPLQCADMLAWLVRRCPVSRDSLTRLNGSLAADTTAQVTIAAYAAMKQGRNSRWSLQIAKELQEIEMGLRQ